MTDNKDTDIEIDADIDADADFENDDDMIDVDDAPVARPSLREIWDNNPLLKLGAIGVGGVAVIVTFLSLFGGKSGSDEKALIVAPDLASVSATPGSEDMDPEYRRALEERNIQEANRALMQGTSALPVPIGTSSESGLQVPQSPESAQADPLTAWRQEAEARRQAQQEEQRRRQAEPAQDPIAAMAPAMPEFAPMMQPVRPQPQPQVQRANPELAQNLAAQMRVIIAAQAPSSSAVSSVTTVPSSYVQQRDAQQRDTLPRSATADPLALQGFGQTPSAASATGMAAEEKTILPAGSVVYGQLMNQLNSDMPGPVLVSLASGPFAGGRAIGTLEVREDHMILSFSRVVKDGVTYRVQAVALDEATTLTGQRSSIDRHYFTRIVLPAAAEFIRGYARSASQLATSTTTTDGGGVVQETSTPDTRQELLSGAEEAADVVSEIFREQSRRPVTVHLNKGTTMGLLFLDTVTTASAQ